MDFLPSRRRLCNWLSSGRCRSRAMSQSLRLPGAWQLFGTGASGSPSGAVAGSGESLTVSGFLTESEAGPLEAGTDFSAVERGENDFM